jgi:hypothetical protein
MRLKISRLLFWITLSAILTVAVAKPSLAQADPNTPLTAAERQSLAQSALRILTPIHNALPTLSPAENQWVQSELKALLTPLSTGGQILTERYANLAQTREYAINMAHGLDGAYTTLTFLAEKRRLEKRGEVLGWATVSYDLKQSKYYWALNRLASMGLLDPKLLDGADAGLQTFVADPAWSRIVIPYLNN